MSERADMPGDDGVDPSLLDEMMRRVLRSMGEAEVRVGFVHDVLLHEEYGRMSVALPISVLDEDGEVATAQIWIPPEAVPTLRQVLKKLNSPEVLRHLPAPLSGLRTPPERSTRRPGKKPKRR